MKLLLRVLTAAAVAAPGIVLVNASPAAAVQLGDGTCSVGEFCVYEHNSYTGCMRDFNTLSGNDLDWNDGFPAWNAGPPGGCNFNMNDRVTSFWNRSSRQIVFFQNNSFGGDELCANPSTASPNVQTEHYAGLTHWNPNDSFSSHYIMGAGEGWSGCRYIDNSES